MVFDYGGWEWVELGVVGECGSGSFIGEGGGVSGGDPTLGNFEVPLIAFGEWLGPKLVFRAWANVEA